MFAGRKQRTASKPSDADRPNALWKLIVGLGNPGSAYSGTRHNMGFDAVDLLASYFGETARTKQFGGLTAQVRLEDQRIVLIKPQSFMNRSGQVVATAAGFYKLGPESILVITDDVALECGRIRLRASGSAGGHNGLSDIIAKLGSQDFARLRIGVGSHEGRVLADYVLGRPTSEQRDQIDKALVRARDAALCWVSDGAAKAMSLYNSKADEPPGE